jgi:hypothetical protein
MPTPKQSILPEFISTVIMKEQIELAAINMSFYSINEYFVSLIHWHG